MRLMSVVVAALVLSAQGLVLAQGWIEFASLEDRFTCNFPGQPQVTETTSTSEFGATLPTRVYSAEVGQSHYSMTVIDYSQVQRMLAEKVPSCPEGSTQCSGSETLGAGYGIVDVQGAIVYASWKFMQRDATLTDYQWGFIDLVEGHRLQLTNNADQSRTFATIHMHEDKLYVMEATTPAGDPVPGLFQQSLGWLDEDGMRLRYRTVYSNEYPKPER